jgi:hypothetical protein
VYKNSSKAPQFSENTLPYRGQPVILSPLLSSFVVLLCSQYCLESLPLLWLCFSFSSVCFPHPFFPLRVPFRSFFFFLIYLQEVFSVNKGYPFHVSYILTLCLIHLKILQLSYMYIPPPLTMQVFSWIFSIETDT